MFDIFFDLDNMHQAVDDSKDFEWAEQIDFDFVKKVSPNKDGCICTKCRELFPYAEPNQPDGTLICYSCRKYG